MKTKKKIERRETEIAKLRGAGERERDGGVERRV